MNQPAIPPTSHEYKIHQARQFHNTAATAFEVRSASTASGLLASIDRTLSSLLIAVDYLIEAQEAQIAELKAH